MINSNDITRNKLEHRFATLISQVAQLKTLEIPLSSDLTLIYDKSNTWIQALWQEISDRYTEQHRYYHTLTHIVSLLNHLDIHQSNINNVDAVELAIWYHDIIYDPIRSDNEQKSADYFKQSLQSRLLNSLIDQVVSLIIMTAKHQVSTQLDKDNHKEISERDAKYFLDMDLAILGIDWPNYHTYTEHIRLEYAHVNDNAFREGRKTVLAGFLERERLYFTDDFYQKYEQRARHNIKREIKLLSR